MSQRFKAAFNPNGSKNTRLDVAGEFSGWRFGRDALAHVSRYLFVCERLVERAKALGRPLRVLDVGCGDVYVARTLVSSFQVRKADVVERYVGLDIDDVSLARTARTLPGQALKVELLCGDITTGVLGAFADKEFDVLVCTEVLEHVQPEFVEPALREFKRVARWGMISTPNGTAGTGRLPEDHVKEWDAEELTALMRACGFVVERRIGTFCNLPRVRKLAQSDPKLRELHDFLAERMDAHFLSLTLARFVETEAQNVLYLCDLGAG